MRYCFIHQNLPGQFGHLIKALCADTANEVWGIVDSASVERARRIHPRLNVAAYAGPKVGRSSSDPRPLHPYLTDVDRQVRRGQVVARVLRRLKAEGRVPDLVVAHPGWGEALFIKDILPDTPLLTYFEFFYAAQGADVGFDPEFPASLDGLLRLRVRNSVFLSALNDCDAGWSPTRWQKSRFPEAYEAKISVLHEGVDVDVIKPKADASFEVDGRAFRVGDPVVTYVARNLEPYRGFHVFMRMLPQLLSSNPAAHVVIVGGDDVSYGGRRADGKSWRQGLLDEVGSGLDTSRVHFTGKLPFVRYVEVLQVSAAHVYLTYPFVLSWSMVEAMAAACLVIGSRTPPVEEVIDDARNGLLVDFFDTHAWVEAISTALRNPDQGLAMRRAARETAVRKFDLRSICLPAALSIVRSLAASR